MSESPYLPRPSAPLERVLLALIVLAIGACYVVLITLEPSEKGYGTHEQLGMAPCSWPILYGKPCPTCGVTTAASMLLRLRPLDAFLAQPFGTLLTLAGAAFAILAARHAWRGESLFARLADWPLLRILLVALVVLLLSWWWVAARM